MSIGPQPVSVKGVLFRLVHSAHEVLLLRNSRSEWELPGGRIEAFESHADCLAREFLEETGLVVEVGPPVHHGVLTLEPPHAAAITKVSIAAYGCNLKGPASTETSVAFSAEHNDARWVPVGGIATLSELPHVYRIAILNWHRKLNRPAAAR